jgi:chemotaxis signal transduction protein
MFAIPIDLQTEIAVSQKIFHIPSTPRHHLGEMNRRGNTLSIVDIRQALSPSRVSAWPDCYHKSSAT